MRNQIVAIVAASFLAACASAPQDMQRDSRNPLASSETSGIGGSPYPVGSIPAAMLHDSQRNKDLSMTIEYPTRGGPYPVIVFSHGYGSSKEGYVALTEYWTGHGYVVIKPSHDDAGELRRILTERRNKRREETEQKIAVAENKRKARREAMQQARPDEDLAESIWSTQTPADWQNRARDLSFIIDSLGELQTKYPELKGKMETKRIGVAGHSYGAFATMLLTGATSTKTSARLADSRIKSALAISPQGLGDQYGLTAQSWSSVHGPIMYMTGSNDTGVVNGDSAKWRRDPFAYTPAGDVYFVSFEGARHITFTGGLGIFDVDDMEIYNSSYGPTRTVDRYGNPVVINQPGVRGGDKRENEYLRERNIFNAVKISTTAWWDATLKEEAKAKDFIRGTQLEGLNGGHVTVERK